MIILFSLVMIIIVTFIYGYIAGIIDICKIGKDYNDNRNNKSKK